MPATEIYQRLLHEVSSETEIPAEAILSNNRESDVVDARYILIHLLSLCGFSSPLIARLTGKKSRLITYAKSNYENRLKQSRYMRHCAAILEQKIGDTLSINRL